MTDFDDEGFSATVKFTSPDAGDGSMTTYLVRGMVSRWPGERARWYLELRFPLLREEDAILRKREHHEPKMSHVEEEDFCSVRRVPRVHSARIAGVDAILAVTFPIQISYSPFWTKSAKSG